MKKNGFDANGGGGWTPQPPPPLATPLSAPYLPLRTNKFYSVLFSASWSSMLVVINTDSLIRGGVCGRLHGGLSQILFTLQQSSIDSQLFVDNRDLCLTHLHSTPPLGRSPSENCHDIWYRKTRMVWLDVEIILKICLFVLTEDTNVTDGRRVLPHQTVWK